MSARRIRTAIAVAVCAVTAGAAAGSASAANYGAIYLDKYNGAAGASWDYPTLYRAQARALRVCRAQGGTRCRPVTWYRNGCGAVAWSTRDGHWGAYGGSRTMKAARTRAMQQCTLRGGGCRVRISACTTRYY